MTVPGDLVTGEAVALDIRPARLASRASALAIDLLIMASLSAMLGQLVQIIALYADEAVVAGVAILVTVAVFVGYPATMETLTRGRTVGKMAMGTRTVSVDGGPVLFRQALMRALAGVVEFLMFTGAPALLCSLFNRQGRRLGDLFAGTLVIQDRTPSLASYSPVAQMPMHLVPWAQSLELSRITDDLALSGRQYLQRFWELLPEVRDELGWELMRSFGPLLTPPPPPGARPEVVISAVLAERRRRESVRLSAQRHRREEHLRRIGQHVPADPPPPPVFQQRGPAFQAGLLPPPQFYGPPPAGSAPYGR
ncbi:RDD family protein [Actinocorallia longicatena]|uniref:RDD family protein n=1 Tax=Actinocorallia longicatena TaxID=111803 RepID=A0ABP6QMZ2_9ACTN